MYNVYAGGDDMIIDLIKLKSNIDKYATIDLKYSFSKEEMLGSDIISLDDAMIKGYIGKDSLDEFAISLTINGVMVLPCAITLKPVNYPFDITIEGNLTQIMDEMNEKITKIENSIDILPIVWENILMEIPMRVVSPDAENIKLEGDGWKLITELEEHEEINPALAKLKDLL